MSGRRTILDVFDVTEDDMAAMDRIEELNGYTAARAEAEAERAAFLVWRVAYRTAHREVAGDEVNARIDDAIAAMERRETDAQLERRIQRAIWRSFWTFIRRRRTAKLREVGR